MTTKELEKAVLRLKANDKIHLAETLLYSLDKPNPEIEKIWIKESEDRIAAYERNELKTVSAKNLFKNIRRKVK